MAYSATNGKSNSVLVFLKEQQNNNVEQFRDSLKRRMTPSDTKPGKFQCDCGGNHLTFDPKKPVASCWSGCNAQTDLIDLAKRLNVMNEVASELGYTGRKLSPRKTTAKAPVPQVQPVQPAAPAKKSAEFDSVEDAFTWFSTKNTKTISYRYGPSNYVFRGEQVTVKAGVDTKTKSVMPVTLHEDGKWRFNEAGSPWPFFVTRQEIAENDVLVICEGEKAASAIGRCNSSFVGVTSRGGSGRAKDWDWSTLPAENQIVLFPDNDESGTKYAHDVAGLINRPILILDVSSLTPKGDAADLLEGLDGLKADSVLCEFVAANARPYEATVAVAVDEVHPALQVPDTDGGRGRLLAELLDKKAMHVHEWKASGWLWWTGQRWERASSKVQQASKKWLPAEIARRFSDYKSAREADDVRAVSNALSWISTDPRISTCVAEIDKNPWLFNCANGTLDLETMSFRPADPADRITKISPTVYDPEATCPRFMETLEYFIPDPEIRDMIQMHAGSALAGIVTHLKLPILYGQGNNGKSTIIVAIGDTFGTDYVSVLDAKIVTATGQNHDSDTMYHLADLHGKRFVVVNELEENAILKSSALKKLISSDPMKARRPYEMPFDFTPSYKAVLLTNHRPKLRTTDNGTMRRLALVPFDVKIDPEKDVKNFNLILKSETSGILNWLIEGCSRWKAREMKIDIPEAVAAATDTYASDEDQIGQFFAACVIKARGGFVAGKMLFDTYRQWCEASGYEPVTLTAFGRRAQQMYSAKQTRAGILYSGIIVRLSQDDD